MCPDGVDTVAQLLLKHCPEGVQAQAEDEGMSAAHARADQAAGNHGTDTAGTAGDHGHLAGEIEELVHESYLLRWAPRAPVSASRMVERVSAGSMTASISRWAAASVALPTS